MRCVKCGNELEEGAAFCPRCGEKVSEEDSGLPIYQCEVKGLLKSGKLLVYRDKVEFVVSPVQKMTFRHASLAAVRKGLDRINFIMEDGRTEACVVNRKNLHEAFYVIDQAVKPYLEKRKGLLQEQGVRFSFPSSPSGLGGVLSNGLLNLLDDRCDYTTPAGKKESVSYRDVKTAQVTGLGVLEFTMYNGTRRAYTVEKELREEISAFFQTALTPFVEERKARLLAMGIFFSFPRSQGTINIYADRLEFLGSAGQREVVPFPEIRAIYTYEDSLEAALTDGTSKLFPMDPDFRAQVLDFLTKAIAPYEAQRTQGFDCSFGSDETLEINPERGVFHVLRQNSREISEEYKLADLVQAEMVETAAGRDLVSALLSAPAGKTGEERVSELGVLLTLQTGGEPVEISVRFGSFPFGVSRTSPDYERSAAEQVQLAGFLAERCPDCRLVLLPPVETAAPQALPEVPPETPPAVEAPAAERAERKAAGVERDQFGTLIDGIRNFVEQCGTPMAIAIQGDWESGSGSFLRMVHDSLSGNVFWLNTWQFSQPIPREQLPLLLGGNLIELLEGAGSAEAKSRAKLLTKGVIGIASGLFLKGAADSQTLTNALFGTDPDNSLEQKVKQFQALVKRKASAGNGRVLFFVDGLNRLSPAQAVELLDAMRYYLDCPGCVFIAAVDREQVIQGMEGRGENGGAYFDKLFKTGFRVLQSSFDVPKYVEDNLGRANIRPQDPEELRHYSQLAILSVGPDPKALERLFSSLQLLRSVMGEAAFASRQRRLTMFALLCMQSRFPGAYRELVQKRDLLTPAFLSALAAGADPENWVGPEETEKPAFRAFFQELCAAIDMDGEQGISREDCAAFAEALSASAVTSMKCSRRKTKPPAGKLPLSSRGPFSNLPLILELFPDKAVFFQKFLQVPVVPNQHDLGEPARLLRFVPRHLLAGADAAPNHGLLSRPVKGRLGGLFEKRKH